MVMATRIQTLDEAVYILHSINSVEKSMNSTVLQTAMGK